MGASVICFIILFILTSATSAARNMPQGYPNQPAGYPNKPSGYPNQPSGYPNQPPGFQPPGYQPPGYPNHPGYPMQSPPPVPTTTPISSTTRGFEPTLPQALCPDATSSTNPLGRLRHAMRTKTYTQMNGLFDAIIVFYSDEHLSEEPSPDERRLEYISGWDGPGTAAVLADGGAAIWVPSPDVRRARHVMSCAWIVLDADDANQPTIADWISARLGRNGRVGADSRLTSWGEWEVLTESLRSKDLQLFPTPTLIDQLWNEEPDINRRRPEFSRIVANLHNRDYTGLTWREKVQLVRKELKANEADAIVITALDEVAWLLNIRGRDLPYAPLLKAFVIVSFVDIRVYAPPGKLSMPVQEALAAYNCVTRYNCTTIKEYPAIYADLRGFENTILIPTGGTFQRGASAAIALSVPKDNRLEKPSPIIYLKAQKNEAEIKGMKRAHLRDAVAMCTLLSYLEGMVRTGGLSEISVATKVDITRATQAGYVGLSMPTRVAFGPSGTEPEYRPTNVTNRRVFSNSTLIITSGGQYDEGTTVVTRTIHFGTPTRDMKKAYTTVLRAVSALATLQVPTTLPAAQTDPVARSPLWTAKQDYMHITGHGVGAAMNRREDPVVIDYRQDTNLHELKEGYFITDEPAWYERLKFGVRLGNVLEVVSGAEGYLGFREATLIPFEPKLIEKGLLTEYEITWLNQYNERIRNIVGPELKEQGLTDVYFWMTNKTVPLELPSKMKCASSGINLNASVIVVFVGIINIICLFL